MLLAKSALHLYSSVCCALLPAGMVARQLLRTFKADSETDAGVGMSSHAGEKTVLKKKMLLTWMRIFIFYKKQSKRQQRKALPPTFSAAGRCALEGVRE